MTSVVIGVDIISVCQKNYILLFTSAGTVFDCNYVSQGAKKMEATNWISPWQHSGSDSLSKCLSNAYHALLLCPLYHLIEH